MTEFDHDAAAAKIYPAEPKSPASDNQQSQAPNTEADDAMYRADPWDEFPIGVRQPLKTKEDTLARVLGLSAEERLSYGQNFATLAKAGLPDYILGDLLTASVDADIADVRGVPGQDPVTVQANAEQMRADLIDLYGLKDAEKWLRLTSEFISKTPALAAILGRRGNSARKHLVLPILEHVRRQHLGM